MFIIIKIESKRIEKMEKIAKEGYTMVSKEGCLYCDMSQELFEDMGVDFTKVYMEKEEILAIVSKDKGTYPFIFKDGEYIGGFKELNRQIGF